MGKKLKPWQRKRVKHNDEDHYTFKYTIEISAYGKKAKARESVETALLLALHRAFKTRAKVRRYKAQKELEFDSYAYDGEHEGHDTVIKEKDA